ncbi:hypothetical protein OG906_42475 (plasmid) [Streptomyces sp. NBC_01426]|uniref:hypothetical protein n=1 Tax=Streptomyces sp. NBC_01426 TaxID=2975866 RepID=UPI002E31E1F9|nr:hypothetical protein [Streptomyces sp. NBC_01426]
MRAQLSGARTATKADQRLRLSRGGNTLIGASLHAAARADQGMELTPLEQLLVGAMGEVLAEEEVTEFGRIYQEQASTAGARELFPDTIAGRALSQGFTVEELVGDFDRIGAEIAAQPNASLVRLDQLAFDAPLDSDEFIEALGTYGGGITVVTGPQDNTPRGVDGADAPVVAMSFRSFTCRRASNEAGKDEIYWTSSAGSDTGTRREYQSGEFGSIKSGHTRDFTDDPTLFHGTVDAWLTCNITCWEADHSNGGWYNALRGGLRDIADYCFKASEDLENNSGEYEGSNAWFSLVGLIAKLFDWLLGLFTNEDDLIRERSFGFSRSALKALANRPEGTDSWDFNGGSGGHHTLKLRASFHEFPVDTSLRHNILTGSTWGPDTAFPAGSTSTTPALASYEGTLYCVVRGVTDQGLYWSTLGPAGWSSFTRIVGAESPSAPAIAAYDGKLYCVYRSAVGMLYYTAFDGTLWSSKAPVVTTQVGFTQSSPALAAHAGKLYCVYRDQGADDLHWIAFDSSGWGRITRLPDGARSPSAPALAVVSKPAPYGDDLVCAFRAPHGMVCFSVISPRLNEIIHTEQPTLTTPGLAWHDGKMHCITTGFAPLVEYGQPLFRYIRTTTWGTSPNGRYWLDGFTGISLQSGAAPALASHNGKLYCVRRG